MKLIHITSLIIIALTASCVGPYDYPSTYSQPYYGSAYNNGGYYNNGYSNNGFTPASNTSRSSSGGISPGALLLGGALAYMILSSGSSSSSSSDDYGRCEYCSQPATVSGRWCNQHAAAIQEQMDRNR